MQIINNRYRILDFLGEGGMGKIYRVMDTGNGNREVALKVLHRDRVSRARVESLKSEFELLSGLDHPNIEEVYEFGVIKQGPESLEHSNYFTSEFLRGKSLARKCGELDWQRACDYLVPICRGLQYLHSRELVHYDIKPENILTDTSFQEEEDVTEADGNGSEGVPEKDSETVKIIDFGLAGKRETDGGLEIKGTPSYIAPEVIRGNPVDGRADLYSLGILLYNLISGTVPYRGEEAEQVLKRHLEMPVSAVEPLPESVPEPLEALVHRMLAKHPGRRPQNANRIIKRISQIRDLDYAQETETTLRSYMTSPSFVGRDEELNWLSHLLEKTDEREAGPRFALIRGEEGIGKTTLLKEFRVRAQLEGKKVLEGRMAGKDPNPQPYALFQKPVREMVRHIQSMEEAFNGAILDRFSPYLQKIFPEVLERSDSSEPESLETEREIARLLDRTAEFFLEGSRKQTVVLLLDDLHNMDSMSRRLLEVLVRKASLNSNDSQLLITGTTRKQPSDGSNGVVQNLTEDQYLEKTLPPLTREEVREMVESMFGEAGKMLIDEFVGQEISGNPLMIEGNLQECLDREILQQKHGRWKLNTKSSNRAELFSQVESLVERRLVNLDGAQLEWLKHLALWGGRIREEEAEEMFPSFDRFPEKEYNYLQQQRFLEITKNEEGRMFAISHDIVERKLLEMISGREENEIVSSFLSNLQQNRDDLQGKESVPLEKMARFSWETGNVELFQTYGEQAAESAKERFAYRNAIWFYKKLLQQDTSPSREVVYHRELASLYTETAEFEQAREHLEASLEMDPGTADELEIRGSLAETLAEMEAFDRAEEMYRKVISRGESLLGREDVEVDIREHLYNVHLNYAGFLIASRRDYDRAKEELNELEEKLETGGISDETHDRLSTRIFWNRAVVDIKTGQLNRALERLKTVKSKFKRMGDRDRVALIDNNIGIVYDRRGNSERAREFYKKYKNFCDRLHDIRGRLRASINLGALLAGSEEFTEALDHLEKGLELCDILGSRQKRSLVLLHMGICYNRLGYLEKAKRVLQESRNIVEATVDKQYLTSLLHQLGVVNYWQNDTDDASSYFNRAYRRAKELNDGLMKLTLKIEKAKLHRKDGEYEEALELLESASEMAQSTNLSKEFIEALSERGILYRFRGNFKEAQSVHDRIIEKKFEEHNPGTYEEFVDIDRALDYLLDPDYHESEEFRARAEKRVTSSIQAAMNGLKDSDDFVKNRKLDALLGLYEFTCGNKRVGMIKVNDAINRCRSHGYKLLSGEFEQYLDKMQNLVPDAEEPDPHEETIQMENLSSSSNVPVDTETSRTILDRKRPSSDSNPATSSPGTETFENLDPEDQQALLDIHQKVIRSGMSLRNFADLVLENNWNLLSDEEKRTRIKNVLELTNGNKSEAARLLGITRQTIYNHLRDS